MPGSGSNERLALQRSEHAGADDDLDRGIAVLSLVVVGCKKDTMERNLKV
jgi:hypothetical protein